MYKILMLVSYAALVVTLAVCLLYFLGTTSEDVVKWTALGCTVVWFAVTPLWMGRELPVDAAEVEI